MFHLLVTPKQLSHRADFYHRLEQVTAAGVGLIQGLEMLYKSPPHPSFRQPIADILAALGQGSTFSEGLRRSGRWMSAFDVALLEAGERSGRLPDCFKLLGNYYEQRKQLTRQALSALMYPIFLFHFAVLIGPFPAWFQTGDWVAYGRAVLGVLLPIYLVAAIVVYAAQGSHGEPWRAWLERFVGMIPVLGSGRRSLALARLCAALEALINAGLPVSQAWPMAADASGSPALKRLVAGWSPELAQGTPPSELVNRGGFPDLFQNMYATGELTGQLDDSLRRLHSYFEEEGSRNMRTVAEWTPKLIYFLIVLMIAWRVIAFWLQYFNQLSDVMK